MKKLFTLTAIFFLLKGTLLHGQAVITESDFINAGDTVRISFSTDFNIDYATAGANALWDFSNLVASNQELIEPLSVMAGGIIILNRFGPTAGAYSSDHYNDFTGIPFDQFGGLLPLNIEEVYRFTRNRSNAQRFTGLSLKVDGVEIGFRSDTIETVYEFPLNFGDNYSSVGYTNIDFNPLANIYFKQYRKRNSTVDGHGTLITPYGTFDVLRVHHEIDETDSLYIDNPIFPQTIPLNLPKVHEYEWIANGEKLPVLKVVTQEILGNETVTSISYRDNFIGFANTFNPSNTLSIFPNPAQDILHIESDNPIHKISIYSLTGKKIKEIDGPHFDHHTSVSLEGLSSGIYLINISQLGQTQVHKIVID